MEAVKLAGATVEERLLRALVSKEHQGIPRRALGYLVREHPVVVPAVHPLPHVFGADMIEVQLVDVAKSNSKTST